MMNEPQPNIPPDEPQPEGLDQTQPQAVNPPEPSDVDQTQPQVVNPPESSDIVDTNPQKVARKSFRFGFLISFLVLIVALTLGSLAGYTTGVSERVSAQSTLVSSQLSDQFSLVNQDIKAGRYSVARQRLEFIIGQDPSYPGASDKLAQVLVELAITPSPIPSETPTLTPTPDTRAQEAIFAQAQQQLTAKDWTNLMGSLDSLRKADPNYKTAIVDSMYYTALRNRGVDQILGTGAYKTTNLEGGIYDLTLAERFGPLDGQSAGLRNFARLYITAASFWNVDWAQAVNYFQQVAQFTPNLRDSSNMTANQRLYHALLSYGDQLNVGNGRSKDRCRALDLWTQASTIAPLTNDYQYKFNQLNQICNPPTATPKPEPSDTPPPTP